MQVGEGTVALTNIETWNTKENSLHVECMGISKTNVPRRTNLRKEKEARNFLAHTITVVKWGIRLQTAGNMKKKKIRDQKIGKRKMTRK